jgi:hypothetical protein
MLMPIIHLPHPDSAERSRLLVVDEMRKRALERLYAKRTAIEDLIQSLESYQRSQGAPMAECREFTSTSGRKCS